MWTPELQEDMPVISWHSLWVNFRLNLPKQEVKSEIAEKKATASTVPVFYQTIVLPEFVVNPPDSLREKVYTYVEQMPEAGFDMNKYLEQNIHFPYEERRHSGKVIIHFTIDEKGNVTHATVVKSAGLAFDREALRIVENMPQWKPGMQNGKPVKVYLNLPVTFTSH
jgi:TonB family protein